MSIKNMLFACVVLGMSLPLVSGPKRHLKQTSKKTEALKGLNKAIKARRSKKTLWIEVPEDALVVTEKEFDDAIKMVNENEELKNDFNSADPRISGNPNISLEEKVRTYLKEIKIGKYLQTDNPLSFFAFRIAISDKEILKLDAELIKLKSEKLLGL